MKTARLRALAGAAGLAIAFTAAAAGTAAGSTTPAAARTADSSTHPILPSFSKLSTSQAKALSSGKQEPMVVVFDDQLTNLPADRAHKGARTDDATSLAAPIG